MAPQITIPSDLKYSKDHIYVRVTSDGTAVLGLSDYIHHQVEAAILVDFDVEPYNELEMGRGVFGTFEGIGIDLLSRSVSLNLHPPVSGTVIRLNSDLQESPDLAITDPYNSGWLIEIRMSDDSELAQLMSPQDYEDFLAELS